MNDDPASVKQLDMFLFNYSKIQALDTFIGLTTLIICQQAIQVCFTVEGLGFGV